MENALEELPYIFDLLYDIKTREDINDILEGRPTRCSCTKTQLLELANEIGFIL